MARTYSVWSWDPRNGMWLEVAEGLPAGEADESINRKRAAARTAGVPGAYRVLPTGTRPTTPASSDEMAWVSPADQKPAIGPRPAVALPEPLSHDAGYDTHDRRAEYLTGVAMELAVDASTVARAQVYATLAAAERTAQQAWLMRDQLADIRMAVEGS